MPTFLLSSGGYISDHGNNQLIFAEWKRSKLSSCEVIVIISVSATLLLLVIVYRCSVAFAVLDFAMNASKSGCALVVQISLQLVKVVRFYTSSL